MGAESRTNPFTKWKQTEGVSRHEVYDRYGRQIGTGDIVSLPALGQVLWRVTSTRPVLHKDAPPGVMELSLVAVLVEGVAGGQPVAEILKVRDALEYMTPEQLEQARTSQRGGSPPPPEPPPPPFEGPGEASKLVVP